MLVPVSDLMVRGAVEEEEELATFATFGVVDEDAGEPPPPPADPPLISAVSPVQSRPPPTPSPSPSPSPDAALDDALALAVVDVFIGIGILRAIEPAPVLSPRSPPLPGVDCGARSSPREKKAPVLLTIVVGPRRG